MITFKARITTENIREIKKRFAICRTNLRLLKGLFQDIYNFIFFALKTKSVRFIQALPLNSPSSPAWTNKKIELKIWMIK
jgi:hypothetical protein